MEIRFKKLCGRAVMPSKAHRSDAGFDLVAVSCSLEGDGCVTYGFGIAVEIPAGYAGFLFPRSSVYRKELSMTNCVGVIDSCYRGEIRAKFRPALCFRNSVDDVCFPMEPQVYAVGERVAQLVVMPVPEVEFVEAGELSASERGEGGFGSTGK